MSGPGLLIGLDVGTSGARAVAVDLLGNVVASASAPYPLSVPRPGWTEQDPQQWWSASQDVLKRVVLQLSDPPLALGLTGQMHGSVFLDGSDHVIRPALLWSDQRTESQCRTITEKVGAARLIEITGNPAITGFQAPKVLWLGEHEPGSYARVRHLLLPKDYIRLRLTGEFATDASDASGTLLLDLNRRQWSDEILAALEIPRAWLPEVFEGPDLSGRITPAAASATGLPTGLAVAAGAGDNAAAAVGNGIVREGLVSSSIGTSGVVFADSATPRIEPRGRLHAFCHATPGRYHLMGVTLSAGGSLRWWREAMDGQDYEVLSSLAARAPAGCEGLVFLPYLTGERTPHLDPRARGAFVGLNLRHTQAHLTRAVMEGVVYSLKDSLDLMEEIGVPVTEIRATGGGSHSLLWRQMQADVFGRPVHRVDNEEGPAFGAALLAGVAGGAYADVPEACSVIRLHRGVEAPDAERHRVYQGYHAAYVEAYKTLAPLMHTLADLSAS
ncbi:MAG: xylulokinase [Chloroflexi bacterium]|nr:MAG: xylulokinase [Chloroflexota bacterium]